MSDDDKGAILSLWLAGIFMIVVASVLTYIAVDARLDDLETKIEELHR